MLPLRPTQRTTWRRQLLVTCRCLLGDLHGSRSGQFHVDDTHLLANTLYAQGLGAMQLARLGLLVKEDSPGVPTVARLSRDQVRDYLVAASVAMAVGIEDEREYGNRT